MASLSAAAQAVLDAAMQYEINPECYSREIAIAVLREAAELLHIPKEQGNQTWEHGFYAGVTGAQEALHVIADELETHETRTH